MFLLGQLFDAFFEAVGILCIFRIMTSCCSLISTLLYLHKWNNIHQSTKIIFNTCLWEKVFPPQISSWIDQVLREAFVKPEKLRFSINTHFLIRLLELRNRRHHCDLCSGPHRSPEAHSAVEVTGTAQSQSILLVLILLCEHILLTRSSWAWPQPLPIRK